MFIFRFYKNSFLANIISFIGTLLGLSGVGSLTSGLILPGIGLIAAAILVMAWASNIADEKALKKARATNIN